jgi:hypothetical protein
MAQSVYGIDALHAEEDTDAIEAMEGYLDFADYRGTTIFSEQTRAQDWKNVFIVDARNVAQPEAASAPRGRNPRTVDTESGPHICSNNQK